MKLFYQKIRWMKSVAQTVYDKADAFTKSSSESG